MRSLLHTRNLQAHPNPTEQSEKEAADSQREDVELARRVAELWPRQHLFTGLFWVACAACLVMLFQVSKLEDRPPEEELWDGIDDNTTSTTTSTTRTTTRRQVTSTYPPPLMTESEEVSVLCGGLESCRDRPFIGVNLGGWLVLDNHLLPTFMNGSADERSFIAKLDPSEAKATMDAHWSSFVTQDDISRLANEGRVTHVRIPTGYWLFSEDAVDGYVTGGERYLFRLLDWLKIYQMKAVLVLDELPGRGSASGSFFDSKEAFDVAQRFIKRFAEFVLRSNRNKLTLDVIVGVEPLKEPPWRFWNDAYGLRTFYEAAVPILRKALSREKVAILLGFGGPTHRDEGVEWLERKREENVDVYTSVFYDTHIFHNYGDNDAPGRSWRLEVDSCKTCCRDPVLLKPLLAARVSVVVGEYSVQTGFRGGSWSGSLEYLRVQTSLWAASSGIAGSFYWNFKRQRRAGEDAGSDPQSASFLELLEASRNRSSSTPRLITRRAAKPCPGKDLSDCPAFRAGEVLWTDDCEWKSKDIGGAVARPETIS